MQAPVHGNRMPRRAVGAPLVLPEPSAQVGVCPRWRVLRSRADPLFRLSGTSGRGGDGRAARLIVEDFVGVARKGSGVAEWSGVPRGRRRAGKRRTDIRRLDRTVATRERSRSRQSGATARPRPKGGRGRSRAEALKRRWQGGSDPKPVLDALCTLVRRERFLPSRTYGNGQAILWIQAPLWPSQPFPDSADLRAGAVSAPARAEDREARSSALSGCWWAGAPDLCVLSPSRGELYGILGERLRRYLCFPLSGARLMGES